VLPFDLIVPDVARREACAIQLLGARSGPTGTILFREFYCNDPGCDFRRVLLHAIWVERKLVVA